MFISAILAEGSASGFVQFGHIEHLFKASETETYEFVSEFMKKYHSLPDPETIANHLGDDALVEHKEPAAYYYDLLVTRHVEVTLKKAMKQAADLFMPESKDPQKALEIMASSVMELMAKSLGQQVVDFRDAYDLIIADYAKKLMADDAYGLRLGWTTFDDMSGGLIKGDAVSFVGRPAMGKTFQMLYSAHYGWHESQIQAHPQSRMFVSMEMTPLAIEQRLAAMHSHVPMSHLKQGALTTGGKAKLKKGLTEIQGYGAPFWIVDGNLTATVEDIYMLARQLNPDAIFIDGAYLLKHPRERDRYKRVAENADLLKSELAALCPVVASWQFAKSASKKNAKKGETVGLEDIGYTDAIAQVSSIVLGILQTPDVETLERRTIDILKGRNGEVGAFETNWDFTKMDFSEYAPKKVEELDYTN